MGGVRPSLGGLWGVGGEGGDAPTVTYVHDPGVDIAELFEAEQPGAVGTVIKHIALPPRSTKMAGQVKQEDHYGGGINWDGSGLGIRIWFLTVSVPLISAIVSLLHS